MTSTAPHVWILAKIRYCTFSILEPDKNKALYPLYRSMTSRASHVRNLTKIRYSTAPPLRRHDSSGKHTQTHTHKKGAIPCFPSARQAHTAAATAKRDTCVECCTPFFFCAPSYSTALACCAPHDVTQNALFYCVNGRTLTSGSQSAERGTQFRKS